MSVNTREECSHESLQMDGFGTHAWWSRVHAPPSRTWCPCNEEQIRGFERKIRNTMQRCWHGNGVPKVEDLMITF